jgi:hypothetical protein
VPTFPPGSEVVVIANVATSITSVSGAVAVCGVDAESVAWTVKVLLPGAAGVPESTPLEDNASPAGKLPAVTLQL